MRGGSWSLAPKQPSWLSVVRMGQRFLRGARRPGFFALLLGVFALGLNYHWASSEGHVEMKTLMIGVACLPIGLAMIVCPGSVDLPLITAPFAIVDCPMG
jgi:hypothetical protein